MPKKTVKKSKIIKIKFVRNIAKPFYQAQKIEWVKVGAFARPVEVAKEMQSNLDLELYECGKEFLLLDSYENKWNIPDWSLYKSDENGNHTDKDYISKFEALKGMRAYSKEEFFEKMGYEVVE